MNMKIQFWMEIVSQLYGMVIGKCSTSWPHPKFASHFQPSETIPWRRAFQICPAKVPVEWFGWKETNYIENEVEWTNANDSGACGSRSEALRKIIFRRRLKVQMLSNGYNGMVFTVQAFLAVLLAHSNGPAWSRDRLWRRQLTKIHANWHN